MAKIGELLVSVGADITALKTSMAQAEKELKGFASRIDDFGWKIKKTFDAAFKFTMISSAVGGLAVGIKTLAKAGDEVSDVETAFRALGGSSAAIQQADKATLGIVGSLDLMKAANNALIKNIPDLNKNFANIVQLAVRVSEATGGNAAESINLLVKAISTGKTNILKSFDIIATKGESTAEILKKLPAAIEKLPAIGDGVNTKLDVLANTFKKLEGESGRAVDGNRFLTTQLGVFDSLLKSIDVETLGRALANLGGIFMSVVNIISALVIPVWNSLMAVFKQLMDDLTAGYGRIAQAQQFLTSIFQGKGLSQAASEAGEAYSRIIGDISNDSSKLGSILKNQNADLQQNAEYIRDVAKATKEWNDEQSKLRTKKLEKRLESTVSDFSNKGTLGFESSLDTYARNIQTKLWDMIDAFRAKGVKINAEDAQNWVDDMTYDALEPWMDKREKAEKEASQKAAEEFKKNMSTALDVLSAGFGDALQAAVDGTSFTGKDWAKSIGKMGGNLADKILPGSGQFVDVAIQAIFKAFGGGDNKGTKARKQVDKWFDDIFDEKRLSLVINGHLQKIKSLEFKGNQEGGGIFGTLPASIRQAFVGAGNAFQLLNKIALDTGVNVGNVLANNIGGSLNNLGILIRAVGMDADTMKSQLMDAFLSGQISASEAKQEIDGVTKAMEEGIPDGVGMVTQAWDNLIAAGTTGGRVSTDALRDMAVELKEVDANATGLDSLAKKLIDNGVSADQVAQVMGALKANGIDSIDALAKATDEQLLPVLAQLEDQKFPFAEASKDLTALLDRVDKIPEKLEKSIVFNVTTNLDSATVQAQNGGVFASAGITPFASGGIVSAPTLFMHSGGLGLMGEAGPEAILPLRRIGGRLGVEASNMGGGVSLNIDARGAGPGVEIAIERAIQEAEGRIVNLAMGAVSDRARRGSGFSGF